MEHADRRCLHRAARAGDPGPDRGEVPDHGAAPPRARPDRSRAGVNPTPHRQRPLCERESVHWIDTAQQAKRVLQPAAQVTMVADREADIYPLWGSVPEARFHVLTRAFTDRSLADGGKLFAAAAAFPVAGWRKIALPARDPGQPKRTAMVELRYGAVEIRRPEHENDRSLPPTVSLRVLEVREVKPPSHVEPLHWRLLTTHTIPDAATAWQIVGWYQQRRTVISGDEVTGAAIGR